MTGRLYFRDQGRANELQYIQRVDIHNPAGGYVERPKEIRRSHVTHKDLPTIAPAHAGEESRRRTYQIGARQTGQSESCS